MIAIAPQIKLPPVLDISHHVPVSDFRALEPLPWLIITKATESTYYLDATYADYADRIRDAGIRLGAYHFMQPGDEIRQADWFCEIVLQVGLRGGEILACDLEVDGISLAQVKNFLDRVQNKTGIRPLIYSTQLRIEGLYPNGKCPTWLKSELLWIAEYPPQSVIDKVTQIPLWIVPLGLEISNIALFQYSDDGVIGGIKGNNVDLNLINPDYALAIGLTEPGNIEPPPPNNGGTMIQGKIKTFTNIRDSIPGGTYKDIGDLQAGTVIEADKKQDVNGVFWYHLTKAILNGVSVKTIYGLTVEKTESWAFGTNVEEMVVPDPPPAPAAITVDVIASNVKVQGDLYAARGVTLTKEQ